MQKILFGLLIAGAWLDSHAQAVPFCPKEKKVEWTNCNGTSIIHGAIYAGGFKRNQPDGYGVLLSEGGATLVEGEWLDSFSVRRSDGTWRLTGSNDQTLNFVLTKSIKKDGTFRLAWTMTANHKEGEGGDLSARALVRFDCATERWQSLQWTAHSGPFGSGDVKGSIGQSEWLYVAPGTMMAGLSDYVCSYRFPPKQ